MPLSVSAAYRRVCAVLNRHLKQEGHAASTTSESGSCTFMACFGPGIKVTGQSAATTARLSRSKATCAGAPMVLKFSATAETPSGLSLLSTAVTERPWGLLRRLRASAARWCRI